MSTMSGIRRKLTAHKELRVATAMKRSAIRAEQVKPDYRKLNKKERRERLAPILNRFRSVLKRKAA